MDTRRGNIYWYTSFPLNSTVLSAKQWQVLALQDFKDFTRVASWQALHCPSWFHSRASLELVGWEESGNLKSSICFLLNLFLGKVCCSKLSRPCCCGHCISPPNCTGSCGNRGSWGGSATTCGIRRALGPRCIWSSGLRSGQIIPHCKCGEIGWKWRSYLIVIYCYSILQILQLCPLKAVFRPLLVACVPETRTYLGL